MTRTETLLLGLGGPPRMVSKKQRDIIGCALLFDKLRDKLEDLQLYGITACNGLLRA